MSDINLLHEKDDGETTQDTKKAYEKDIEYTDPTKQEKAKPVSKQTWIQFLRSMFLKPKKPKATPVPPPTPKKEEKKPEAKEKKSWFSFSKSRKKESIKPGLPLSKLQEKKKDTTFREEIKVRPSVPAEPKEKMPKAKEREYDYTPVLPKDLNETPKDAPFFTGGTRLKNFFGIDSKPKPEQKETKRTEAPQKEEMKELPKESRVIDLTKKKKAVREVEYSIPSTEGFERKKRLANVDVNLVPNEFITTLRPKNYVTYLGWIAAGSTLLVIIAYAALALYDFQLKNDTDKINEDIQAVDSEINSYLSLQQNASLLKERIDGSKELLDKHIYWSAVLDELQKVTLKTVYFESMTADINGTFKISAFADSFESVAQQMRVLEKAEFVKKVEINGGSTVIAEKSTTEGEPQKANVVQFSITLEVNPDVFLIK